MISVLQHAAKRKRKWHEPLRVFFDEIRPRALRTMQEFAEEEITRMPQGPRAGLAFRCNFMPWTGLILREFESGRWRRMFGRGAAQSGKTLIFTVIPTLYHLFEMEESVIFGAPTQDLAYDIFCERVLPIIHETRYARWLPSSGAGSRGGKTKAVRLRNGAILRFMGAKGADSQRSSYSSRVAVLTEVDHMEREDAERSEAAPPDQIEARTSAYDEAARIYGECTTTVEEGRIFLETTRLGSDTRIHLRCPHCRLWSEPVREQLQGWRDAQTIVAAHEQSRYICQRCEKPWTETDRQTALQDPRLVHRGQTVDDAGNVLGPLPETYTLGLVWSAMHSPLRNIGTLAEEEWKAEQSLDESLKRKVLQFNWTLPWKMDAQAIALSYAFLAGHVEDYHFDPLGAITTGRPAPSTIPPGIHFRIGAVDVQKRNLYVSCDGFDKDLTCWTLFWHVVEIVQEGSDAAPDETHLRQALDEALHLLADLYRCDSIWIDAGYKHEGAQRDVVKLWCAEQGPGVNALVGRAAGAMERMTGERLELAEDVPEMIQCRLQPTGQNLWFFDVDRLKDEAYFRLFRVAGSPGYHYFPAEAANAERTDRSRGEGAAGWIFSHYMRSKRVITQDRRTGREIRIWEERGRHDLWDLAGYALGGAYITRAEVIQAEKSQASVAAPESSSSASLPGGIRTKY